jgi:cell division protein FtsZ
VTEAEKVVETVHSKINPNARIIWGASVDHSLEREIKVMLVITGVTSKQIVGPGSRPASQDHSIDFVR